MESRRSAASGAATPKEFKLSFEPRSPLGRLIEDQRRAKSMREEGLGPVAAAAGMVRESCATTRLLLDDLEASVGLHLEILDAVLRRRFGNRWWDQLAVEDEPSEEVR